MKTLTLLAVLTFSTSVFAGEANSDLVCKKTVTFEETADGSTVIVTKTVCESK